jgi:hypothetical protein
MALSRAKWIYTTVISSAREPMLDGHFRFTVPPPLPIDAETTSCDFEAQLLVCWRVIMVSPSFTADPTRRNSGQGTVNCTGWEDDMARVDRRELAVRVHDNGNGVFPMLRWSQL